MAAKSLLPILLAAGVGAVVLTKKKTKKAKKGIPEDYLNGYLAPGATVGAAEGLSDIENIVKLTDIVMRDQDGNMHKISSGTFQPDGTALLIDAPPVLLASKGSAIERVVTNFYGPGAVAFEGEVMDEFIEGPISADPKDPEAAPAVALAVLKRLRTKINWDTVEAGSAAGMVLGGATIISRIVQQQLPGA